MKKKILIVLGILLITFTVAYLLSDQKQNEMEVGIEDQINGLIMLIEFESVEGINNWDKALKERNLTALISVQEDLLNQYSDEFRRLAEEGHEISGTCSGDPFWDMPYEQQYDLMKETKEAVEVVTGKPMRVLGSKYFAYDENTLKAADQLGIDYVLARGTAGEKAMVYKPNEYDVKIISVSNIPFQEMGTGSLCDYSLWARGATAEDFSEVVTGSIDKNPSDMILVSHAYLGGTRLAWWKAYEKALDSDRVSWRGFDDWIKNLKLLELDNADIPTNREVKYEVPKPSTPIEMLDPVTEEELLYPVCY